MICVFSCLALSIVAQDLHAQSVIATDFTGKWILDVKASSPNATPKEYQNQFWEISQNGSEVKIRKSYDYKNQPISYNTVLYIDGRGETNSFPSAIAKQTKEIKSKTVLRKGKLVRKFEYSIGIGRFTTRVVEEFRLSSDGEKLILDSQSTSDLPPLSDHAQYQIVFRREPETPPKSK